MKNALADPDDDFPAKFGEEPDECEPKCNERQADQADDQGIGGTLEAADKGLPSKFGLLTWSPSRLPR